MTPRPLIFISAVSRELRSARQLVANTLTFLGYQPIWQDIFGTDYTLSDSLGQSGQITIPLGVDSVVVTLTAVADHVPEKKETAIMTLNTGAGYKLAKPQKAKVKILDAP